MYIYVDVYIIENNPVEETPRQEKNCKLQNVLTSKHTTLIANGKSRKKYRYKKSCINTFSLKTFQCIT